MSHKSMIWLKSAISALPRHFAIALDLLMIFLVQYPVNSAIERVQKNSVPKTFPVTLIAEAEPSLPQRNHEAYQQRTQQWREQQSDQKQKYQDIRRQQQEQFQRHNDFRRRQQERTLPPEKLIRQPE
ncbi:hypothetical protein H1P_6500006 [Hyella patelloides LEGE 07179]|uniref:Uncharacterized protein n=1 Tax=Hyella patelloides LEGE 07179 TaxID=945734 RepID=A0A563W2G0_9CYAN|nr:hypothetical protein [Hyella patelloides]VEP17871.1 hypothetical protein H1P_6500006 [Hyella patelloides LEGE 07179]